MGSDGQGSRGEYYSHINCFGHVAELSAKISAIFTGFFSYTCNLFNIVILFRVIIIGNLIGNRE